MSSSAAQWILLAAPVVAGAITAAYGLMFALSGRDQPPAEGLRQVAEDLHSGVRRFVATASVLAIILLIGMTVIFAVAAAQTGGGVGRQVLAFLIGAMGALLCCWIEPAAAGRGVLTQPGLLRQGYEAQGAAVPQGPGAVEAEGMRRASASGLFAFGLALLSFAAVIGLSAGRVEEALLGLAIGAACAAALLYGAGAITRGAGFGGSALWLPEFFGAGLYAVITVTLAAAAILGRREFEEISWAMFYPAGVASAAALAALIAVLAVRPRASLFGAANRMLILALLIAAGLTYLLRWAALPRANMFSTVAIGLGATFILSLLAQHPRGDSDNPADAASGIEVVVLAALVAAIALAITLRLAGGFGAALCATGLLAAGPFAAMLAVFGTRLSKARALAEGAAAPAAALATAARNARLAAGGILGGAVLLTTVALFRLAMDAPGLQVLDLDQPYIFAALVFGATAPFLLGGLALRSAQGIARRWGQGSSRAAGTAGAAWRAMWRMLWLIALAAGLPVAVAYFWGLAAAAGLLVGLAAAALFGLFAIYLSGRPYGVSGVLAACASPLILIIALVVVRFGEAVSDVSQAVPAGAKIQVIAIVAAVLLAWLIVEALYALATAGGRQAPSS